MCRYVIIFEWMPINIQFFFFSQSFFSNIEWADIISWFQNSSTSLLKFIFCKCIPFNIEINWRKEILLCLKIKLNNLIFMFVYLLGICIWKAYWKSKKIFHPLDLSKARSLELHPCLQGGEHRLRFLIPEPSSVASQAAH